MKDNTDTLVYMANQIGAFFNAEPDQALAEAGVANHIKRFWAPSMRSRIFYHVDHRSGEGLNELVLRALKSHRGNLSV
ncbi:MAG: formate dehydrogenase subunit delta [Proteobacteria bacterium]|nr:formate dehydrogenase subunit delta [Pseudomonadota bacterium]